MLPIVFIKCIYVFCNIRTVYAFHKIKAEQNKCKKCIGFCLYSLYVVLIDWLIKEALLNKRSEIALIKSLSSRAHGRCLVFVSAHVGDTCPVCSALPRPALASKPHRLDSSLLCQIKGRSPDPPPAHIMMLIMEPISRRLCHAPVPFSPQTCFWLAVSTSALCILIGRKWREKPNRSIYSLFLSLSHTLSCRFITFQIKLSFPTTAFPVPFLEISRECPSSLK